MLQYNRGLQFMSSTQCVKSFKDLKVSKKCSKLFLEYMPKCTHGSINIIYISHDYLNDTC